MKTVYVTIGSLIVTGIAALYSYSVSKKANNLVKILDVAADKIAENVNIDISPAIVKEATDKAIDKAVAKETESMVDWMKVDLDRRIKTDVKAAVDSAYSDVKESVKVSLNKQLENVDISSLKREVADKAAEIASEKFADEFQGILDNYNGQLKNVANIYQSIAKAVSGNNDDGKTISVRLG